MAAQFDLHIDQGTTYTQNFIKKLADGVTPQNLTGYTARMMIRAFADSSVVVFDSDDEAGSLTVTGAEGKVTINLSDEITGGFPAPFTGVYDVELDDGAGVISRLVQGEIIISPNVTR